MSRITSIALLLTLCFTGQPLWAQNNKVYTQYLFNALVINPAYAGTQEALQATSIVRKQWLGVEGSPFATTLSVHSPVSKHRSAFGGLLYQSSTSIYNELTLQGVYSYRINLSERQTLSLGLSAGLTDYSVRYNQLTHQQSNDPAIPGDNRHLMQPLFSGGLYYYTASAFAGLSSQNMTGWLYQTKDPDDLRTQTHSFAYAGKVFMLSPVFKLKPSFLIHYYTRSPLLVDINVHALINEIIWLGISYRHQVSVNYLLRFQLSRQLSFGYSYDQSINSAAPAKKGTHEIVLSYLFKYYKKNIVNPRDF